MLKLIAEDFIKHEHIEKVKPLYKELVAKTKQEPGCVAYDLFIDQNDPGHFIFIEEWINKDALNAHCRSEHFSRLVPIIDSYQTQAGQFLHMNAFE